MSKEWQACASDRRLAELPQWTRSKGHGWMWLQSVPPAIGYLRLDVLSSSDLERVLGITIEELMLPDVGIDGGRFAVAEELAEAAG